MPKLISNLIVFIILSFITSGSNKTIDSKMVKRQIENEKTAVDVRVFLLTIVVAMSAAFLAGVSIVPESKITEMSSTGILSEAMDDKMNAINLQEQQLPLNLSAETRQMAEKHVPSGQHLLVDIEGIEASFLDSEERLTKAMIKTVDEAKLTMLSYHCHKLLPAGISCVGVLLESHISFHTWPEEGVITLDLFTCGANPLLPVVSTIERLFGVGENVSTKWSHELRGFRSEKEKKKNYLDNFSDLSLWILSPLEVYSKKQVFSNLTKIQRVDIWDLAEMDHFPSHDDGIKHNLKAGDPRWLDQEFSTPDRILFLDGTVQSLTSSEKEYHEALIHPAMFSHPKPTNVAILGGGEGGSLREVLKHNTVESVTMIEIDEELIGISREYLPTMSDCSDFVGRAENCFDDPLLNLLHQDGHKYFMDRYAKEEEITAEKFDVIIIDALDPEDEVEFSHDLYGDESFITSLMNGLTDEGVLLVQTGTAPDIDDPKADAGVYSVRETFFNLLENHQDVGAMLVYEEPRCGFLEPHSFLLVCKSATCRSRWYARSDEIDYEIYERIIHTKSKKRALHYYDGTTQYSYQVVPKAWETVYCRREPTPFECAFRHLDHEKELHDLSLEEGVQASSFEIRTSKDEGSELKETFVYAKVDIAKGSYIMPENLAQSLVVTNRNLEGFKANLVGDIEQVPMAENLLEFFDKNGHESLSDGSFVNFVESGGTVLIRSVENEEEANVGRWVPLHPSGKRPVYSPVYDRHRFSFDVFMVAKKNIPAGTELLKYANMWSASKKEA